MANLVITATSVIADPTATLEDGTAGATITAGQAVYLDTSTQTYKLADCDSATLAVRTVRGIALEGASAGQPLRIIRDGPVTIGATIAAGVAYYLSPTAGAICPVGDLASGDYPVVIGMGLSTTVLKVRIVNPGVALA